MYMPSPTLPPPCVGLNKMIILLWFLESIIDYLEIDGSVGIDSAHVVHTPLCLWLRVYAPCVIYRSTAYRNRRKTGVTAGMHSQ